MLTMTISAPATALRIGTLVLMRATSRFPVRLSCVERFVAVTGIPVAFAIAWLNRVVKLGHPPQSSWAKPTESPIVTRFQPAGLALADELGTALKVDAPALAEGDMCAWHAPSKAVTVTSRAETFRRLVTGPGSASV
jgi:hypothetical protein